MKKIGIFGAGGYGKEVIELIRQINLQSNEWEIVGFFDDNKTLGSVIDGLPVLGGVVELNAWNDDVLYLVFAIGNPIIKENIERKISNAQIQYPVLIHPSVIMPLNDKVSIGKGTVICGFCFISVNVIIGEHVLVNVNSTIGHDSVINNFTSIMPAVNISGNVKVGRNVFIGVGAKIINDVSVGDNVTIGMASAVLKNAPPDTTLMGVPARIIINK